MKLFGYTLIVVAFIASFISLKVALWTWFATGVYMGILVIWTLDRLDRTLPPKGFYKDKIK